MKKKILALVMSALMVLSLTNVFAVAETTTPAELVDNANIEMTKDFIPDANATDGSGTIKIEAFVKGALTTETVSKPTDIVMVLDASGSMDETITLMDKDDDPTNILKPAYADYYMYNGAVQTGRPMRYYEGKWQYNGVAGLSITNKWRDLDATWFDANITISRMDALKIATQEFVDSALTKDDVQIATVSYNYWSPDVDKTQVVTSLTDNAETLKTGIKGIETWDGTNTHRGLQEAKGILDGIARDRDSNKVVILFSDGDADDTNAAYTAANSIKGIGAEIYSVGVGTTASTLLNKVSSNYDTAGNIVKVTDEDGNLVNSTKYYQSATTGADLESIFESISEDIGGAAVTLDSTATVTDIISPYFQVDTSKNISVQTAQIKRINGDVYKWNDPVDSGLTATVKDKNVSVTGFDFSANWVGKNTTTGELHKGKKLIIEIPVKPADGFIGGNKVPTNDSATITTADGTVMESVASPTADVPIKFTPDVNDVTIYRGNSATLNDVFTLDYSDEMYKYVNNPVAKVVDKDGHEVSTFAPEDCETYTLTWEISPKESGTVQKETGSTEFTVHVLQPTITTKDVWVDYNTNLDMVANNVTTGFESACDCTGTVPPVQGEKPSLDVKFTDGHESITSPTTVTEEKTVRAEIYIGEEATGVTGDFDINLNRYNLEIFKYVNKADFAKYPQDFIFDVTVGNTTTQVFVSPDDFKNQRGEYAAIKTVKDLYVGQEITVTERTDWSWRYTPSDMELSAGTLYLNVSDFAEGTTTFRPKSSSQISDSPTDVHGVFISVGNELTNKNWISIVETIKNVFSSISGGRG